MSFDVKYDKNGNVISPKPTTQETNTETRDLAANNSPAAEVEQPESVSQVLQEASENNEVQTNNAPQEATQTESAQAKNFRQLREKAERAERERDELVRLLKEQQQAKQVQPQDDDEIRLAPDDLAEGKHLTKIEKKYKKLEEQFKQYQAQTAEAVVEAKIKAQYPDFDKIVSRENIEALRGSYPELAQTLNASSDLYSKAVSAYTLIKKLGIVQEDLYQADRERAIKNAAKPKPSAAVAPQTGNSPLAKANAFAGGEFTKELQEQMFKEMNEARKNY